MTTIATTATDFAAAVRAANPCITTTIKGATVHLRLTHSATGNGASRIITDLTADPAAIAKALTDQIAAAVKATRGAIRRERSAT